MAIFNRMTENDFGFMAATPGEQRAAALRQEEERAAFRQSELASQASPLFEPHERIRIWEKLHALQLPLAPKHKLLSVIAAQTELTIEQVEAEQARRAAGTQAPVPTE